MKENDIIICGHGSGTPRLTKMGDYLAYRYSQKVTKNGKTWRKGLICVLRPVGITEAIRRAFVRWYKTILGRNKYSQKLRKYCYEPYTDGLYYSDCSSSQCKTFSKAGLSMPDYNTEEMLTSKKFKKVPVIIKDGHILNPEILLPCDQLMFAGTDPNRKDHVGHVEGVYQIGESNNIVAKYQEFLNDNKDYAKLLEKYCGGLLKVDGDYGDKTRKASVCVWKYMYNKYYGGKLTLGNEYFLDTSTQAAEDITNAEVKKHPTFGYILNGVLAGRGYKATYSGTITADTTAGIMELQNVYSIPQTGRLSGETWRALFN